eukprot:2350112-Prymnesium_polylepis.1
MRLASLLLVSLHCCRAQLGAAACAESDQRLQERWCKVCASLARTAIPRRGAAQQQTAAEAGVGAA